MLGEVKLTRKVALNTLFQLLGKGVSLAVTLFATAFITRSFGEDGYGNFTLMTTFPAYFYLVVDFGMNAVAVRLMGEDRRENTLYFRSLYTLRVVMSLVFIAVALVFLPFIPFRTANLALVRWGIVLGLLTILTQSLFLSCNALFQKNLRYDRSVLASILGNIFTLVLVVLFLRRGFGLLWMVGSFVLGGVLMVFVSFVLVRLYVERLYPSFNLSLWKKLLKPALPLGAGLLLMVVMAKADMFILSVVELPSRLGLSNERALGLYGLSYKVFENALVFPTFFINALYPIMIFQRKGDLRGLFWTVKKAGLFLLFFGLVFALGGYLLTPLVVRILAGPSFSGSVTALRLLFLGLPVFFPSALSVWLLVTLEKEKYIPPIYGLGALFNIAANLFFIPRYGFLAAAVTTGLTEVLVTALTVLFGLRFLFRLKAEQ